jgi:hypothetical protein
VEAAAPQGEGPDPDVPELEPVAAPALLALDVAALASLAAPEETPLLAPESVLPRQAATDKRALTAQ